jgi:2-polyprenyl-6-methoxyphenol hydroxylase-like FAD-dependent oxidoreductase
MNTSGIDALIVGAGPVGLTMAAALAHHGLNYRQIEKIAQPTDKSKALVLWSRSMELFEPLGAAASFLPYGLKAVGGTIHAEGRRIAHLNLQSDESPFGYPLMIPQSDTEHVLIEHLATKGKIVERQAELLNFVEGADSVVCRLRHADGREESLITPWLIGCDGAHSTVRHGAAMNFTGHAEPNDWMLADVHIAGALSPDEINVFLHAKGVLVFFPISKNRYRMIADLGLSDPSVHRADPTLADVQAKLDERGPGALIASEAVWLSNFRINERKVADYRRGRIMLAGDAAHVHSPAGGQGMNTGMQDAFNLAWKLALIQKGQGKAEPLLQSFSMERSAVGDQVLRAAEAFTTVATLRNPIAQSLRNQLAPILSASQFFQDKVRRSWQEISINCRHSPLSAQGSVFGGGQQAGDRLCYAPLTAADGRPSTTFAVLDGTHHALLLLPGADADSMPSLLTIAQQAQRAFPNVLMPHVILQDDALATVAANLSIPVFRDAQKAVYPRLWAAGPTMVLVRPDGYIGYRARAADGADLIKHLGLYLCKTEEK